MAYNESEARGTVSGDSEDAPTPGQAAARYAHLAADKYVYLQRARQCARVTIPYLFPMQGHSSATNYYTPFQDVGSDGLSNLASKLLLVLFPPNEPFFRLKLTPKALKAASAEDTDGSQDIRGKLERGLSSAEDKIKDEIETKGGRISAHEAVNQILVAGNALWDVRPDNRIICHRLENYVVRRDVDGNPMEVILRQNLKRQSLPKKAREILAKLDGRKITPSTGVELSAPDKPTTYDSGIVDLFTVAVLEKDQWKFWQELSGYKVPGTDGTWPKEAPGLIPLVWYRIAGEHYGRGKVEQHLGALNTLEAMTQSMVEGFIACAKVLFVVDDTGLTDAEQVANAPSGSTIPGSVTPDGRPKDIGILKVDKATDFNFCAAYIEKLTERLDRAFLRSQTRDAERVTAEEIRLVAKELNDALGGAYSVLAQELQAPLVRRVMLNLQKQGTLKFLPDDMVRMEVVAGLEGLGRENDLENLDLLLKGVADNFGQEAVAQEINTGAYVERRGLALHVDTAGLVKSDQQKQQEAQAAQQQEMKKTATPHMIKAASDQLKSQREHPDSPVDQPGGPAAQMAGQAAAAPTPQAKAA